MTIKTIALVTGGAGFIGAHVTKELILRGHDTIVLDDLSGGSVENVDERAIFIEGSITDSLLVEKIFTDYKIDYVYHFAAYAAEGLSHFIKRFNYMNNLIGSVNLINESVKNRVKCFVFTSSIAVYGKGQLPMSESMPPQPEDSYGIAKLAVEMELKVTKEMFGLDYIVFRPHNVYGEYQNIGDKYRNVLGIFMNQLLQNKPVTMFGEGNQSRAFSYIGDIAPVIARCVEFPEAYNEVFNIGAEKEHTVKELAEIIMKTMGIRTEIRYLPPRNEVKHAYADHSKAEKIFGIKNTTSLEDGVGRMARWVNSVGVRKTKNFEDIEITEKLPSVWLED